MDNAVTGDESWGSLLGRDRCILVVIDKQRWYLDPLLSPYFTSPAVYGTPVPGDGADAAVRRCDELIAVARRAGVPVVWTTMTEGDPQDPANLVERRRRHSADPVLLRGDEGFAFHGTSPAASECVFAKVYPGAFSADGFEAHLRRLAGSTVVLIGGYAGRCVLATAFAAQVRGFDVVVGSDLIVGHPRHPEEEAATLRVVEHVIGHAASAAELSTAWAAP